MRKFTVFSTLIFLSGFSLHAQSSSTTGFANGPGENLSRIGQNIIPPSPEAFNFTKHGNLPVGHFTGSAQFSIPVYTISSGTLKHSISLDYATNGIKVDEIASRAGLGWTLRVGGTITRNVQGLPDEFSDRSFYHGPFNSSDTFETFFTYVRQAEQGTPPDFQPDDYSFNVNGLSGKFIQRENGEFKILSANGTKIEQDNYTKNFTLIGTDGVKYYFNYQEKTKALSQVEPIVPSNAPGFTTTAWFLTKIISPTNDSILFNYASFSDTLEYYNGISQENSLYIPIDYSYRAYRLNEFTITNETEPLGVACLDPDCLYLTTNPQISGSLTGYLSSITFQNGKVDFVMSSRDDVPGEKKMDSIKVIRLADSAIIKAFALNHSYSNYSGSKYNKDWTTTDLRKRLYLNEVHEVSKDLVSKQTYKFDYADKDSLPPRLSFAQDHFGYYNGKVNQYFFPNDTWVDNWLGGSGLGGNRKYDFNYAALGVLNKITYPTGGYSVLQYEPHKVKNLVSHLNNIDSITISIDTSTIATQNTPYYTDTFHVVSGRSLRLNVKCDWASIPATFFPEAYKAVVSIIDVSNNNCATLCDFEVSPGNEYVDYQLQQHLATYNLSGGIYKIKISASLARLRIRARVDKITSVDDTSQNVGIAGIRVKAVSDFTITGSEFNRREFIYGEWTDSTQESTSGRGIIIDPNNQHFVSVVRRYAAKTNIYQSGTNEKELHAGNTILHSNSVRNVFYNESGSVVYEKVIELNHAANNSNVGGTEYKFIAEEKTSAAPLSNSPLSWIFSFSPFQADGFPQNNDDYKNGLLLSSKTFTYQNKFASRTVLKTSNNFYTLDSSFLSWDTLYLVRLVKTKSAFTPYFWNTFANYDINRYFRYYSWVKLDSTITIEYSGSDSIKNKVAYTYTGANYKINSQTTTNSDGSVSQVFYRYPPNITSSETGYSDYLNMSSSNIIDPVVNQSIAKNSNTKAQNIYYDNFSVGGNSFYQPHSVQSQLNSNTPETEITFEQYDSKGNVLQFKGKDGLTACVIWGYNKTYPVAKIVGASYNTAIALLDTNVLNNPSSDYALRTHLNNLRTGLTGKVLITTLSYAILIGTTSQTDPTGNTIFYEYDHFNRLSVIRNEDSVILKKYCYKYANEPADCNGTLMYENKPLSQGFTRNNCSSGLYGSTVIYTVAQGKYRSTTGQTYVDSLAQVEINTYGQSNANTYGTCTTCNTATNCTGLDKKCISGICETGEKVCTSSVRINGTWYTTYHYLWSDSSVSADYTEEGIGCLIFE